MWGGVSRGYTIIIIIPIQEREGPLAGGEGARLVANDGGSPTC